MFGIPDRLSRAIARFRHNSRPKHWLEGSSVFDKKRRFEAERLEGTKPSSPEKPKT